MSATKVIDQDGTVGEEMVDFGTLSELTGFPVDFIKQELLLEDGPVSMDDLRLSMLKYLDATMGVA